MMSLISMPSSCRRTTTTAARRWTAHSNPRPSVGLAACSMSSPPARILSTWSKPVVLRTSTNRTLPSFLGLLKARSHPHHGSFRSTRRMFSTAGGTDEPKDGALMMMTTTTTNLEVKENLPEKDVLFTDFNTAEKAEIRDVEINGLKHLSLADDIYSTPSPSKITFEGIAYGKDHRILVMAALSSASGISRNVVMLVNPGSPSTFLTQDTFKALGINVDGMSSTMNPVHLLLNRRWTPVHLSTAHFADVNMLGTDFLSLGEMDVNYLGKTVRITIPESSS